jgi:NitT/TauT family transport system substrate-binding protein
MMSFMPGMLAAFALCVVAAPAGAQKEVDTLVIARQPGIQFLPLIVMEGHKLVEKHLQVAGLKDTGVVWQQFAGGADTNTAILSGTAHFAAGGVPPFLTLWDKTRGGIDVKGVAAMSSYRFYLNSRDPKVKSIRDFTDKDRIALPGVKVSMGAVVLQMMVAKEYGIENYSKLDHLTVSMSFPDGMVALLSGKSEITAHFASPPFHYHELRAPGVHKISDSYDVLGPATTNMIMATRSFRDANPKTYAAFFTALAEATELIGNDKKTAADIYLRVSGDKKTTRAEMLDMLNDPEIRFTITPFNTMKWVDFMYRVKSIKNKPDGWRDLFFPEVANLAGS